MASWQFFNRYRLLSETNALLRRTVTVADVFEVLRSQARAIANADGVALVQRVGDEVAYVGEDAIAPLWTGQRFPLGHCVTGLAILARERIVIADIGDDPRVPMNLYLATFVRSMAIYPLGGPRPIAAIGLYWREPRVLPREVDVLMTMLASGANAAFETIAIAEEQRLSRAA